MKHIVILGDGMADLPIKKLGGRTPRRRPKKAHMDRIGARALRMFRSCRPICRPARGCEIGVMGYGRALMRLRPRGVLEARPWASHSAWRHGDAQQHYCIETGIQKPFGDNITSAESDVLLGVLRAEVGGHGLSFFSGLDTATVVSHG